MHRDKPENANQVQPPKQGQLPEDLIARCLERATSITIRQRRNKKGTSITISFSNPR